MFKFDSLPKNTRLYLLWHVLFCTSNPKN